MVAGTISVIASNPTPTSAFSVNWSPDGNYLAVADGGGGIFVYQFDRGAGTISVIASDLAIIDVQSVNWSPDGNYLAVADGSGGIFVYQFDRGAGTISVIASDPTLTSAFSINWSPDGSYLAITSNNTYIYQVLLFPHKNVITGNTVYCNSGGSIPSGVGISGSSIANLIIQNTAYSNPLNPVGGINQNYNFVTNVFNQLFGDGPTALQNISVGDCQPICMPDNLSLLIKQDLFKADSLLDEISNAILLGNLTISFVCGATLITSGPITANGSYCLVQDVPGGLAINASNVTLDLSGRTVSGGITFSNRDFIKIMNGVVEGTAIIDGITATNSTSITLENVTIRNSRVGANFNLVSGGTISGCTFISNTTGVELTNAVNVTINDSIALNNSNAGFCLLSSTTNCIRDCKAFSTGFNNRNVLDQTIIGFVSADGYGNIFERCIANATQALSTTDYNSLIAGFALRGTEQCTKIIDCESANATTSPDGVTVPYGILLEATFDGLVSVTSDSVTPVDPLWVDWSPDGKYLAVADSGGFGNAVYVYQFDRTLGALGPIAFDSIPAFPFCVNWSPDGTYLAVADSVGDTVYVYQFDRGLETLTFITSDSTPADARSVNWSPNGTYLAVADSSGAVYVYQFDRISGTLALITSDSTPAAAVCVNWSPDGTYLAVADSSGAVYVYQFDRGLETLTFITSDSTPAFPFCVNWSPNGIYLAVADLTGGVYVYQFDRISGTLALITSDSTPAGARSVNWSPDGTYLAVADSSGGAADVYRFDRGSGTLEFITSNSISSATCVNWSPDGTYLAVAGSGGGGAVYIYQALSFPYKNVITGNTVYCNSGGSIPSGVGISGSSIANLIIQNTAYSNPIARASNEPIVGSNYQFVTNVFLRDFQNAPTLLQNISLDSPPINTPDNTALLIQQANAKIDTLIACGSTPITSVNLMGSAGTISLTESGNYCLAQDLTAQIVIAADGISLDLNGHCLDGYLQINSSLSDIVLKNGTIYHVAEGTSNAVITISASSNVIVENVIAINPNAATSSFSSVVGIQCTSASNCLIANCTIFTGNSLADGGGAGSGISIAGSASDVIVRNCVIQTGNGGDSSGAGTGGAGGYGIEVTGSTAQAEIIGCTIMRTGKGGNSASGTGGAGGHGIYINSTAIDVSVRNCTIKNTGAGGAGSAPGLPGKAVLDLVTTAANYSQIFKNFAHNISNPTKFDIQSPGAGMEDGIMSPNPPDATVLNPWANVFTIP